MYFENPALVLTVAILHDTYEDYPETHTYLQQNFADEFEFIKRVSKVHHGVKMSNESYYMNMTNCVITVVVKAIDRLHNLSTMVGVFSQEKIDSYIDEVHTLFLPMIKITKRNNPRYEAVLELLKTSLLLMVNSIESSTTTSKISPDDISGFPNKMPVFDSKLTLYDDRAQRDNVLIYQKDITYSDSESIVFMYNGEKGLIDIKTGKVHHDNLISFYLDKSEK